MFGRKKPPGTEGVGRVPRGRSSAEKGRGAERADAANPLARRLQSGPEPRTVDLAEPARFHAAGTAAEDPQTTLQATAARLARIISVDPDSGKFYVHPGDVSGAVTLGGTPVEAPTELRPGDRIVVGAAEFEFRPRG